LPPLLAVPLSGILCAVPALSVTVRVALNVPATVGLKVTVLKEEMKGDPKRFNTPTETFITL
jgi:hypothetical protein